MDDMRKSMHWIFLFGFVGSSILLADSPRGHGSVRGVAQDSNGKVEIESPDFTWYISRDCLMETGGGVVQHSDTKSETVLIPNDPNSKEILHTQEIRFKKIGKAEKSVQKWEMSIVAGLQRARCEFELPENSYSPGKVTSLRSSEEPAGGKAICWNSIEKESKKFETFISFDKNGLLFWPKKESATFTWTRPEDSEGGKSGETFEVLSNVQRFYPGTAQNRGGMLGVSLSFKQGPGKKVLTHYSVDYACNEKPNSALGINIHQRGALKGNNGYFSADEKNAPTSKMKSYFQRLANFHLNGS